MTLSQTDLCPLCRRNLFEAMSTIPDAHAVAMRMCVLFFLAGSTAFCLTAATATGLDRLVSSWLIRLSLVFAVRGYMQTVGVMVLFMLQKGLPAHRTFQDYLPLATVCLAAVVWAVEDVSCVTETSVAWSWRGGFCLVTHAAVIHKLKKRGFGRWLPQI
jgi:hypothetical protein